MANVSGLYHPSASAEYLWSLPWDYSVPLCDVSGSGLCYPARSD